MASPVDPVRGVVRAVRAEMAKLTWRSGTVWAAIPLTIAVPILFTIAIAAANEALWRVNSTVKPGEIPLPGGYSMGRDNSVYWVLFLATFIILCAAVNSYSTDLRNQAARLFGFIQPARWPLITAKAIVYGAIGAVSTAVGVAVINGLFPRLFPHTWGQVSLFSSEGIRFLWSIPLYTALLVAFGLGLTALVGRGYLVIALVLFAKLGTEAFLLLASPDLSDFVRSYSPFVNAEYSTGQMQGMPDGVWGINTALGYYAAIFLVVFALGAWRSARVPRH